MSSLGQARINTERRRERSRRDEVPDHLLAWLHTLPPALPLPLAALARAPQHLSPAHLVHSELALAERQDEAVAWAGAWPRLAAGGLHGAGGPCAPLRRLAVQSQLLLRAGRRAAIQKQKCKCIGTEVG